MSEALRSWCLRVMHWLMWCSWVVLRLERRGRIGSQSYFGFWVWD